MALGTKKILHGADVSDDVTLAGNSSNKVVTERAAKTFALANQGSLTIIALYEADLFLLIDNGNLNPAALYHVYDLGNDYGNQGLMDGYITAYDESTLNRQCCGMFQNNSMIDPAWCEGEYHYDDSDSRGLFSKMREPNINITYIANTYNANYPDTLSQIQFDNPIWGNNHFEDCQFADFTATTEISNCKLFNVQIDNGSNDYLRVTNNDLKSSFIGISDDNCYVEYNTGIDMALVGMGYNCWVTGNIFGDYNVIFFNGFQDCYVDFNSFGCFNYFSFNALGGGMAETIFGHNNGIDFGENSYVYGSTFGNNNNGFDIGDQSIIDSCSFGNGNINFVLGVNKYFDYCAFGNDNTIDGGTFSMSDCTIDNGRTFELVSDHFGSVFIGATSTFHTVVDCDVALVTGTLTIPDYCGILTLVSSNSTETVTTITGWGFDLSIDFHADSVDITFNDSGNIIYPNGATDATVYGNLEDMAVFKNMFDAPGVKMLNVYNY